MLRITIKELPIKERPRERMLSYGRENLSNEELLSIILKTGTKDISVKELSLNILKLTCGLKNIKNMSYHSLKSIKGIGPVKALELLAVIELAKRIYSYQEKDGDIQIKNAYDIYNYMKEAIINKKQEYVYGLYLDTKKKIIERKLLYIGSLNKSIMHPREIFKEAYLLSAAFIVLIHNHPSGDVTPSIEDKEMTGHIKKISHLHDIELIDHLIISDNKYFSFYENGLL